MCATVAVVMATRTVGAWEDCRRGRPRRLLFMDKEKKKVRNKRRQSLAGVERMPPFAYSSHGAILINSVDGQSKQNIAGIKRGSAVRIYNRF